MSRFTPGQSGNPKGRPKGSKNLAAQILAAANAASNGQDLTRLQAIILAAFDKAATGDQRAAQLVIDRVDRAEAALKDAVGRGAVFTDADREAVAEIHRRLNLSSSAGEDNAEPGVRPGAADGVSA
ncbi:MAG TPA: DUF5681 domain-containing protein [Rhizomicrobium sp.]|jgi:hypothetical protein